MILPNSYLTYLLENNTTVSVKNGEEIDHSKNNTLTQFHFIWFVQVIYFIILFIIQWYAYWWKINCWIRIGKMTKKENINIVLGDFDIKIGKGRKERGERLL